MKAAIVPPKPFGIFAMPPKIVALQTPLPQQNGGGWDILRNRYLISLTFSFHGF